jgi:regulator of replication initiation timing
LTEEITIDLGEIENLEGNLQALTDENTRLTTENTNLQTKNNEQDGIITGTTIPNLLANLEQYASKVSEGELKTTLANITTELASLQKNQEEQGKIIANKKDNNY